MSEEIEKDPIFEDLKTLIEDTMIPDIEEEIDDLFEIIAADKNADDEQKEELADMQELKKELVKVLEDLESDSISQEEATEIYDDLVDLIEEMDEDY